MLQVVLGFLPWILYSILMNTIPNHQALAIISVVAATFVLDFHELKKGFILPWGSLCFFMGLLLATFFVSEHWLQKHANIIANSSLAGIAWLSLLINKPFTLQYAREQVDKKLWNTSIFIHVNQIITAVWATSFLISGVTSCLVLYSLLANDWLYLVLSYGPIIFSVWFTKMFPTWYPKQQINQLIKRSEEKQRTNPFLKGNFAPVLEELDLVDLAIEGKVPQDLLGVYMRNGPNPAFFPFSYTYPFDGDGMLHAVYLKEGKARYKNRFIKTDQLQIEQGIGKAVYGGVFCPFIRDEHLLKLSDSKFPVKIGRFIHIIRHANLYLALHEATSAYEVNALLDTIGEWNPTDEHQAIEVNAHTRLDSKTGELFLMSYSDKPIIRCHVLDKNAQITQSIAIDVPHPCMVHDFVLTPNYVIIFLCPVVVDFMSIAERQDFAQWRPELNTRILVLNRSNLKSDVTWFETEPFFTFHFANACELNQEIVIEHVRYPKFSLKNLGSATLYRTTLNFEKQECTHQQLDDKNIEFPRINEHYNSIPYRYIYMVSNMEQSNTDRYTTLIKYDLEENQSISYDFGQDYEIGEAVFAPKQNSQQEDDGYLMLFIYNKHTAKSDFVILEAQNLLVGPIARVKLPTRVPSGLHGSWFAGEWATSSE